MKQTKKEEEMEKSKPFYSFHGVKEYFISLSHSLNLTILYLNSTASFN